MPNIWRMQPASSDFVTIPKSEYEDLVEIAKLLFTLDEGKDNSEKIKTLKTKLMTMRRKRKL